MAVLALFSVKLQVYNRKKLLLKYRNFAQGTNLGYLPVYLSIVDYRRSRTGAFSKTIIFLNMSFLSILLQYGMPTVQWELDRRHVT